MTLELDTRDRTLQARVLGALCPDPHSLPGAISAKLADLPPGGPLPLAPQLRRQLCAHFGPPAGPPAPAARAAPRTPLDWIEGQARQAQPVAPRDGVVVDLLERLANQAEYHHLLGESFEAAHLSGLRVPAPSNRMATVFGLGSALGLYVKINLEIYRANRDGLHLARCGAFAQGFARVAAAAVAQRGLLAVQRNPRAWPTPAAIPNRNDADYARGVRAGLATFTVMSRAGLEHAAADLVRATPNVAGDPRAEANLALRLAVLLGGFAGAASTRF